MIDWLKYFWLGFFSDKWSTNIKKRNVFNILLAFVLVFVFLYFSTFGADVLPFSSRYGKAEHFRQFLYGAFASGDGAIELTVSDGTAAAAVDGENAYINTFDNSAQKSEYSANGYELIVNTYAANTFAEFEAYYVNDGQKIDEEEYSRLSPDERTAFAFSPEYSGKPFYPSALTPEHEAFLSQATGEIYEKYCDLHERKGALDIEEYAHDIYILYAEARYGLSADAVPALRKYNYSQIAGKNKFVAVFCDYMVGSFETGGRDYVFHGYFGNMPTGAVASTREGIDAFIGDVYESTAKNSLYLYFANALRNMMYVAIIVVVLSLALFGARRILKIECKYSGCVKTLAPLVMASGLIAGVICMLLAFVVPKSLIYRSYLLAFMITLFFRCAVLVMREYFKKPPEKTDGAC